MGEGVKRPSTPAMESGERCRPKLPQANSLILTLISSGQQFWCILGSSGELSHRPAMQNCVYVQAYDLMNFSGHIIQLNYT